MGKQTHCDLETCLVYSGLKLRLCETSLQVRVVLQLCGLRTKWRGCGREQVPQFITE